ncbi:MAG: AAA family ATPase [Bacteroidales bacterium]|jgi:predicted ATP-dependent endonuclease of OLD family|nr:AAA family ATPase [Bacteroidales bacterium]
MINDTIKVRNYKCFDSEGGGFEKFMPINIIIGKNNSGKSSLIDLVKYFIEQNKDFIEAGRNGNKSEVFVVHELTDQEISANFKSNTSGGGIPGQNHYEYGKQFIGGKYCYSLAEQGRKTFLEADFKVVPEAHKQLIEIANTIQLPFRNKQFCNITAERDVVPEIVNTIIELSPNGSGATNLVQHILNRTDQNSKLIEQELLKELNVIVNPDIKFTRVLVQLNLNSKWELFFEDSEDNRIALSKMGSGVKTVLLVLLNLIVRPVFEAKNKESYIFAFEELENNLHPSLQRRLYNYIKNYSENTSTYFFLTTHSNVVIDAFGTYENSQIIHVTNDGTKSKSSTLLSYQGTKDVLNDLGLKASDILQSNGVIWVEGPSDRNYINKWLSLLAPELKEGLHYSIMFYGGRLLSNLSFDFEWFNEEVIPLVKINRNAYVVIDRDGKSMNSKINQTKQRITDEIGASNFWITKGREIENYLSDDVIKKWLKEKHGYNSSLTNEKNTKLEDNISQSNTKIKLKYNSSKTVYSAEISEFIDSTSIDVLDLKEKLNELIVNIRNWNE